MFGKNLGSAITPSSIGGQKLEPKTRRPFLVEGELLIPSDGTVRHHSSLGTIEGRVLPGVRWEPTPPQTPPPRDHFPAYPRQRSGRLRPDHEARFRRLGIRF